jgi:uncharacterized protein YfdQ (DUF2303 family)
MTDQAPTNDTYVATYGDPRENGIQSAIDTALAAAEPQPLDPANRFYAAVIPAGGGHAVIDLEDHLEKHRDRPRRKQGTYRVHDADAFVAYMGKHAGDESEVWADVTRAQITGVLNAHDSAEHDGLAGWEDHTVVYRVQHTDAWKSWIEHDGKLLDQQVFAELIEDRSVDVVSPSAAEMLELAQSFQAHIGVQFKSSTLLPNGERQLQYEENIDARAGRTGHLEIPASFELAMVPFEGAQRYKVIARFRYRLLNGTLKIGYRLERPNDVLRDAFAGVVERVREGVAAPVFNGSGR